MFPGGRVVKTVVSHSGENGTNENGPESFINAVTQVDVARKDHIVVWGVWSTQGK